MNATAHKPTKLELYKAEVLPAERAQELFRSMPSHIKPAVFERNLLNALMANPALMDFPPALVYREVSKAAGLGILLDPILGEGYIVTAYNYKTKRTEPQLRIGYKGMCKLARQSGNVSNIYVHEVCSLDQVECDLGFPKVLKIKPKLFGDRGDVVGYVAVIAFKDGEFDFEPMSLDDCLDIRDRSDAWKAYTDKKIKSTPWATDEGEMCKKTTLRRLLKRQEQSPEMARANQIEDEAEHPQLGAPITVAVPRVPSPAEVEQLPPPADAAPDHADDHGSDKYQPGDEVNLAQGAAVPSAPKDDPISTGPQRRQWLMPNIDNDYDGFISAALLKFGEIDDPGELETFWNQEIEKFHGTSALFPSDYQDLVDAYDKRQKALNAED